MNEICDKGVAQHRLKRVYLLPSGSHLLIYFAGERDSDGGRGSTDGYVSRWKVSGIIFCIFLSLNLIVGLLLRSHISVLHPIHQSRSTQLSASETAVRGSRVVGTGPLHHGDIEERLLYLLGRCCFSEVQYIDLILQPRIVRGRLTRRVCTVLWILTS